jgi:hypothetical protein
MADSYGNMYASVGNPAWTGGASLTTAPESRVLLLDEVTQSVESSIKFALTLADQVRAIADGILGPQPQAMTTAAVGGANKIGPAPRGVGLRDGTVALSNALSALYSEIERLRAL